MKKASNNPLVSVIVPAYNVEKYIKRCLQSIKTQSYNNIQIIIVDDGSTDETGIIIDEYAKNDSRAKVIHENNLGISEARNVALANAKGEYVVYVDPDDIVEKDYINRMVTAILRDKTDLVIAGHTIVYPNKKIKKTFGRNGVLLAREVLIALLYDQGIDTSLWGKLYRTEQAKRHRFPEGKLFEDTAVVGKIINDSSRITVIDESLYLYIIRKKSITTSNFSLKKLDLISSTRQVIGYILANNPDMKKACMRKELFSYLATASQLAQADVVADKRIIKELFSQIKKRRMRVLFDGKAPKRDKIAIISSYLGWPFFRFSWKIFVRIRGKA